MTECKLYRKEEGWAVAVPLSNEWMDFLPVFSLPRAFMVSWTASSLFLTSSVSSAALLVILRRLLFTFCKWKFLSKVWDQKAHAVLFIWRAEDFYKQSSFQHWLLLFFRGNLISCKQIEEWMNFYELTIYKFFNIGCTFICKEWKVWCLLFCQERYLVHERAYIKWSVGA